MLSCYVATTAYDDPLAEEVEVLRDFRDTVMSQTPAGRHLIELYYQHGPSLALLAMEHPELKAAIKLGLDNLVRLLERTDTDHALIRASLDAILVQLDSVLSVLLPDKESAVGEFRRTFIRQHKIPLTVGAASAEP
jgi:hypothetical protein